MLRLGCSLFPPLNKKRKLRQGDTSRTPTTPVKPSGSAYIRNIYTSSYVCVGIIQLHTRTCSCNSVETSRT